MEGICMNFLYPDLFFDSFREVAMATDFGAKFAKWPLFSMPAFRNGLEYCISDLQVLMSTIFATFCAILVKISPLTPEITKEVSVPFGARRQKSTYHTNYLSKYWTELQLFSIVGLTVSEFPKGGIKYLLYFTYLTINPICMHFHQILHSRRGCRRTVITCDKFFGDRLWDVDSVEGWKARDVILISNARCNKYKNDNSLSCRVSEWQNNDNNFKAAFQWVKITCKRHNKTSKLQQTILYSDKILACT